MGDNYVEAQDKILSGVDPVAHISEYVDLKKRGVNYAGLCPFHNEKTGSFTVSKPKGIYKCFGCGKGGNVITFEMEHNGRSWKEAIEILSNNLGIELKTRTPEEQRKIDDYFLLLNQAAGYFQRQLKENNSVMQHLQTRGITGDSIEKFKLGYCPDNSINTFLLGQGFTLNDLNDLGMISHIHGHGVGVFTNNVNDYRSIFNGRIIFPVQKEDGKIVGFGARYYGENRPKHVPKYVNSRESEVYRKANHPYGLNHIRSKVIKTGKIYLVEGYTDVIALQQQEIMAVATAGTALSSTQAAKIKRIAKEVVNVYDSDEGGRRATKRNFQLLIPEGLNVKTIILPEGEDPDSFIKKNSKQKFVDLKEYNLAEFHYEELQKKQASSSGKAEIDDIAEFIEEASFELDYIDDPFKKYFWLREIALLAGIPEELVIQKSIRDSYRGTDDFVDVFSQNYVNEIAAMFVKKLLLSHPNSVKAYLREVPFKDIPDDGSVFSKDMLQLYKELNESFHNKEQLTLFNTETNRTTLEHAQRNQALIPFDETERIRLLESGYSTMYRELMIPTNKKIKLDELARTLRMEIHLAKQEKLISEASARLSKGQPVKKLVDMIEELYEKI